MLTDEQADALTATIALMTGKNSLEGAAAALAFILNRDANNANHGAMLLYAVLSPEMRRTIRGIGEQASMGTLDDAYRWAGWARHPTTGQWYYPQPKPR